ncbi:MAG: DUF1349 domain-containing protein [Planctomycetota bacterium]|nr:DUF1349 domain-containing protein [Planctomycetaceae bacterium]MDQ3330804.1 DUF1349 domain-containing protein [Planctomycetota bacterium]
MHRTVAVALLSLWIAYPAHTADPPPQRDELWGEFIDPDGDSNYRQDGDAIVISVNGTAHDLSAELGRMNAPRILRGASGDFIAQVKLSGSLEPEGMPIPERVPFQASGLLLMKDDQNYIRLERAAILRDGETVRYINFETRENGKLIPSQAGRIRDDADLWLRIERHGKKVLGAVSPDGDRWTSLGPITLELPDDLRIGIAAVNATEQPFEARFECFRLFSVVPETVTTVKP